MGKCNDCDYGSCIGCVYDTAEPNDPWNDPDYPEYDPAEDYDPMGYME